MLQKLLNPDKHPKAAKIGSYNIQGYEYAKQGMYEQAIASYSEAICLNSKDAFAYHSRGYCYIQTDNYEQAILDYDKASHLNPKNARIWFEQGFCWARLGNFYRAIANYTEAIRLDPEYTDAYFYRGESYDKTGKLALAITDITKAISLDPGNPEIFYNRGCLYDDNKEYELAIVDYTEAIQLDPQYISAFSQQVLQSQGDVVVKGVKFDIVNNSRVVVITIETQGGTGEMNDETTLKEALAPFVVAYQSNQTLKAEIETVIVQAQGYTDYTRWFAAANIKHIGLLVDKKITTAEFVMNNIAFKVP